MQTAALNRRIEQKVRTTFQLPNNIDVSVGKRASSEMSGYDMVPVTLSSGGRSSTHQFLISKDNATLIEWEKLDISKDLMDSIDTAGRPERGNKDAKVTIVNYDDFECPFCSRMHQTLFPDLMKTYGSQVKIIYKDYPLVEIHPWAMHAAVDANCLAAQSSDAFWEFADYTHANQKTINGEKRDIDQEFGRLDQITRDLGSKHKLDAARLDACIKKQDESTVRASLKEGEKLGVEATPTLFINGERVAGAASEAALRSIIDRALKDAGQTPPAAPTPAVATTTPAPPAQTR
ncbi:MAG TPA: thioredoxin domain-containing protein [Terriglobales bacterium]|nr:thioredoxin domain-containing protein [Terriglobales bacterium]